MLGRKILEAEKLDTGQAKIVRIKGYVRESFRLGLQDQIDFPTLIKMSRNEIVHAKRDLENKEAS